ncbi:HD-GYP domain-containing protein [Geopsychrobacter electrodiphilus]|uniref:HD-GYP domain-containing protein n=1 Tax=Geopsychrobacter electrodiphilus TaxID=225196 RepID=UPI00037861BA|nr:HD domain-containing phosphohydrolase [Geopsychrobacter electrodiphilus]
MLDQIVEVVLKTLYAKSSGLYNHSVTTGKLAHRLVIAGDFCQEFEPQHAHIAGILHDVGKLSLPDSILLKVEALDESERDIMELHPIWGGQFVQGTDLEPFKEMILHHHECPTGTGYPFGIKNVGVEARVIQVADRLAALMDDRPYCREILDPHSLFQELRNVVDRLFSGEQERKMLHGVRVVLGLAEGKHSRPVFSVVGP